MHPASLAQAGQRDEGFSLIELLVAISLIGIIMSGLAFGITNSLSITRDSRERTIAANLASAEIDLATSVPNTNLQPGTLERSERVGITDFTIRRVSTWENGTAEAPACTALANSASGQGRRFLQVNVSVTWKGMGLLSRAVQASTALTPSVATYTEGKGHVAVDVRNRNGVALSGIPVTLAWTGPLPAPAGSLPRRETTSIGCAFFTDVPTGPYSVTVDLDGYVDSETGLQAGVRNVVVGDRETAKAAFTYDRRTGLDLTVSGQAGGVVPNELQVTAQSVGPPVLLRASGPAPATGNSARRTIGLLPGAGLFPYLSGWGAWAGCAHNAPDIYGGVRAGFTPAPSVPQVGAVQAGTLRIDIRTRDSARAGPVRLYARDQGATGSSCTAPLEVGTFDVNGSLRSRLVVLPYGNWKLFVGPTSMVALNGDPARPAGLIEVRPGVTATYTERLPYRAEVLADSPFFYHRLDETPTFSSSSAATDSSGFNRTGILQSGVTTGHPSFSTTADRSVYLNGTTTGFVATPTTFTNPRPMTLEIWFRTATAGYNRGGRLAGFGSAQTGTSARADRHLYMMNTGELVFGVRPVAGQRGVVLQSNGRYNDAQWHHAVATLEAGGMALYVDGVRIRLDTGTTTADNFTGYLRVGYDTLTGWHFEPSNFGFQGFVDEFAFYTTALSQTRVSAHWNARADTTYPSTVTADTPQIYYRFGGTVAPVALDSSGNNRSGTYQSGVTGGVASALLNDANTAVSLNGTAAGYVGNDTQVNSPNTLSLELWLRTTSGAGGRLLGFGNALTGASVNYDRHLYMLNNGQVAFGVYPGSAQVVQSTASYNDGQWHHVVATLGPGGMALYVDGALVAQNPAITTAENYAGYFRIGADSMAEWPGAPTNTGLNGQVDEVAVYPRVLSPERVADHYSASGR